MKLPHRWNLAAVGCTIALASLLSSRIPAGAQTEAPVPAEVVAKIRDEGLNRSQVMRTAEYLTDVIGPRLTGSPNMKRSNEWTRRTLEGWGLENARLEPWGPFGRGWSLDRFSLQVVAPQTIPIHAYPKAWSPGTGGEITAEVVYFAPASVAEFDQYKGKLKGAIVLAGRPREITTPFEAEASRRSDTELLDLANSSGRATRRPTATPMRMPTPEDRALFEVARQRLPFLIAEGAAAVLEPSSRGFNAIGVAQASLGGGFGRVQPWDRDAPRTVPQIVCSAEDYNRMARMARAGESLRIALDLRVKFHDEDLMAHNTLADIRGTDLPDEVVMVGAHMDSWHGGTGATDNAAGVAVCMEAMRILKALNLQPRRTVRIALWSGEEQGLLGSRAYVARHLRTPAQDGRPAQNTPAHDRFAAYYNLDVGTGKIRGMYLNGWDEPRAIFREWFRPFADMGAGTITLAAQGSTDHVSFEAAGLPGFQFIQDPIDYFSRTHHTSQDTFDRLIPEDLKQSSVILATFAYLTATREAKFPRRRM